MEGHESILSPLDTVRSRPAAAWADACPDGRFVGLYSDGRIRLWDERHSTSRPVSTVMRAHNGQAGGGEPVSCAASKDGLHVATFGGGSEGCVKVWDVRSLVEPVGVMYMGEGSYGEGGGVISFNPRYSRFLAVSGVPRGDADVQDSRDSGPSKKRRGEGGEEGWEWWGQEDEEKDDDDDDDDEEEEEETVSETQEEDDDDQEEKRARKRKKKLTKSGSGSGSGGGGRDTAVRQGHVEEGTVTIADYSKGKMTSVTRLRLASGQSTCVEWNSDGSQLACGTTLGLTHVFYNPVESRDGVASISM